MKQNFTYRLWAGIGLLLLLAQQASAQFPKYLDQFPVITNAPTNSINTLVQKGNTLYLGGNFNILQKAQLPTNGIYGLVYNNYGDAIPNTSSVDPDNSTIGTVIADGSGGWYIFSQSKNQSSKAPFSKIGGVDRPGMARINADGTLNAWNPNITTFGTGDQVTKAISVNGNVLISGSFKNLNGTIYNQPLAMLDGSTGQPLTGWNNLTIPGIAAAAAITIQNLAVSNNMVFIQGYYTSATSLFFAVIDISNPSSPVVIGSASSSYQPATSKVYGPYKIDAQDFVPTATYNGPFPLKYTAETASGNRVYLSGSGYTAARQAGSYANQTLSGQNINTALFAVDAVTGKYIMSCNLTLTTTQTVQAIAADGNTVYAIAANKLWAFDATTGADITAAQPGLALVIPTATTTLSVTADHKLLVNGASKVNNISQTYAIIDIATGTLLNWTFPNLATPGKPTMPANPNGLAESNGKYFVYGNMVYNAVPPVAYQGLAAINAATGEILSWAPADLTGAINASAIYNNTLYLGGTFTGPGGIKNLAAYDITDPNNPVLQTTWMPNPDNAVDALIVNGNKLYAGGDFLNIGAQPQTRLAEFDVSSGTGTLNTTWNPGPDNTVNAFTALNNVLYVGGKFQNIGTTAKNYVAAFDLAGANALTSWDVKIAAGGGIPSVVYTLAAQPADGANHDARIFIGGHFLTVGTATSVNDLVAVNTTDGSPDAWQSTFSTGFGNDVHALTIDHNTLYSGFVNGFNSVDISSNFAQISTTPYFTFSGNNYVKSIVAGDGLLYAGGNFTSQTNPLLQGFIAFQTDQIPSTITFADITKTYGDADAALTATSTNTAVPLTYALSEQKDANGNAATIANITADGKLQVLMPGTAKITASQVGDSNFQPATDVSVTLTINKAQLTVHPQNVTAVVNQPFTDFPFTLTGWIGSDATKTGVVNGKPEFASTATATSPVGTYDLTVSGAGTLASDFYTFTPSADKATLTIQATGSTPQTITFAAIPAKNYGDADIDPAATTDATGLKPTYKSSDESIATIVDGKIHIVGAGTVTITASQAGSPTYAPAADVTQTFTIAKVPLTIKADDKTMNRGDQLPVLTATYTGLVNNDKPANLTTQPTLATTATAGSLPGTYPITASDAASNNYDITYVNGTLKIVGTQIVTWAPVSTLTYGDASFNPGATSDAGASLTPTYTTSNPAVIAISGGQAVIKGAGTATLTATFAAANGFELTTATENITVVKKQLIVTADDKARNYGDANPVFTFTYNGFVNGDNATSGALTAQPAGTTTATATSPVGVYPITVSGAASDNYSLTYINGNLTVNAVARILTFNALPNKTYGNADFNPGASANTGETPAYTVSDPTVATVVNGQIHLTGAGTTTVTASLPANSSYTGVTTATQTLTVAKASLTITADNKTKTQGPPDILLTASYSGFVGNDNELSLTTPAVLTTTANANSPTGTYSITVSGATSNSYDIKYVNGTLNIIFGIGQDQIVVHPMLSPNGDGKNDFMLIDGIQNYPDNHVLVVNRNGAKVYEAHGYDNSSIVFSGKNNDGNSLVAGTYYYEINYTLKGNSQRKTGYIIIKY